MKIANLKHYVPDSSAQPNLVSTRLANSLFAELLNFGIVMDKALVERVAKLPEKQAGEFCESVAKTYLVEGLNPPLFKNWEQRTVFSLRERVIQIFGYILQINGNDLADPYFYAGLVKKIKFDKFKALSLASEQDARQYVYELLNANVSQDRETVRKLGEVFAYTEPTWLSNIKSDEVRAALLVYGAEYVGLGKALKICGKSPADALRYAAGKLDLTKVKLPSDVIYASLKWRERVDSVAFMDDFDFDFLSEGIGNNREAWVRYFRHIHLLGQEDFLKKFKNVCAAFYIGDGNRLDNAPVELRRYIKSLVVDGSVEVTAGGALAYRTFASRITKAIHESDYPAIVSLGTKRPNYILRNLASVSEGIDRTYLAKFRAFVKSLLAKASADVLLSILTIDVSAQWRIIDVKGDTRVEKANYSPIIKDIQDDIEEVMRSRWGYRSVSVESGLRDKVVPFLSKNANLPRGTRIDITGDKYLYFYVNWTEKGQRTDIDHSLLCFDENWKSEFVYFGRLANDYITQSGDITSAPEPNGATEYTKISLDKIPKGVKYICATVNSFTMNTFDTNKFVRAGFMGSNSDTLQLSREHNSYDLDQPAMANVPFVLDVERQQVVMLDVNFRDRMSPSIHGYADSLKNMILAMERKNYISIGRLAKILSGGSKPSAKIVEKSRGENEMEPESMFKIFSE